MEKGEQPTGSLQIDIDPAPEAFPKQLGCFVVNGPASHVDGLEPLGHRADHCIRVAVADQAVIPKERAERGERQMVTKDWRPVLSDDGYDQRSAACRPRQGTADMVHRRDQRVQSYCCLEGRRSRQPVHVFGLCPSVFRKVERDRAKPKADGDVVAAVIEGSGWVPSRIRQTVLRCGETWLPLEEDQRQPSGPARHGVLPSAGQELKQANLDRPWSN